MHSRSLCNTFALVLAILCLPAFPAIAQPGFPQLPGQRFAKPLQPHPVRRKPLAQAQAPEPLATNVTTPNFGGFYAAPYYTVANDTSNNISEDATLTADFDKDGKPDIVSIGLSGSITLLKNDGNGGFLAPIVSPDDFNNSETGIPLAFAADLNGDGYPDIVMGAPVNFSSPSTATIAIALNQKDGTFAALTFLSIPNSVSASTPQFPTFGVVENLTTKYLDLVAVQELSYNNTVQLQVIRFTNSGTGTFKAQPTQIVTLPSTEDPRAGNISLNVADVNGDGIPDLLLQRDADTGNTKYVDVLIGNSNGTYKQPGTTPAVTASVVYPSYFLTQDILHAVSLTGNSSKLDLVLNFGSFIVVALSNGDGTFQAPKSVLETSFATQLLFADLNADGKQDLIATSQGISTIYLGNGDGTFAFPTSGLPSSENIGTLQSNLNSVLADFDGDGKLDLASGTASGHISVAKGNGDGTFHGTPLLYSAKDPLIYPDDITVSAVADLNGDGLPDLLAYSFRRDNGLITGIAKPSGGFIYSTNVIKSSDFNDGFYSPTVADFNGDGKPDVAFPTFKGGFDIFLSNGDGTFTAPTASIPLNETLACPIAISAISGDLNNDKKADLVVTYQGDKSCDGGAAISAGFFVLLGNGDGTFQPATFTAVGTQLEATVLASFHGTGKPLDIVVADWQALSGTVLLLQGKGDGTFAPPVTISSHTAVKLLTDDFNQDGVPDLTIVAEDYEADGTYLLAGNGNGTFATPASLGAGELDYSATYADVNGDKIPDLIGSSQSGLLQVYLGTGKGAFAPPTSYVASYANRLFPGKFLGDNAQTILATSGGGTALFMNQGGSTLSVTPSATTVDTGTAIILSAKLTATLSDQPTPTGTVTYYDGTTKLGSELVGTELSGVNLSTGTHSLTATYTGDTHFNPNTSLAVSVSVTTPPPPPTPDFTFTSNASTLQVTKGRSGTLTFTAATNSTLAGSVTFACSGLPSESTCAFSPASLTLADSASASSTMTITTTPASSAVKKSASGSPSLPFGAVATASLILVCLPRKRLTRYLPVILLGVLAFGGLIALTGCGGGGTKVTTPTGPVDPGTPQGTSSVTVTATAVAGSTTVTHTSTIALTVQ
jgi:hypothetical protein